MIQTVNGPIRPENLGITMCHEHMALDLSPVRGDDDSNFSDINLIADEINQMTAYGVRSAIEVTCNDMGRDVRRLKELSDRCQINIVASTGCYLEPYHTEWVRACEVEALAELFYREVTEGIEDTGVKAGVIGEVASGEPRMAPSEEKVLIAAALAGKRAGCAVSTHCQMGKLALEHSALLQRHGMNPAKIVLGHLDLNDDCNYLEEVLKTGVNIGFDTIGKTAYLSDEARADHLMWLIERGYADQIMLSQDISRKSYFAAYGKYSGYAAVMKDFVPLLEERGITQETIDCLLILNPAQIFNLPDLRDTRR